MLTTLTLTFRHMLVWLTLPFYDFCCFRSVAANSVCKLQFLHLLLIINLVFILLAIFTYQL